MKETVEVETYDYKNAKSILEEKRLLEEIHESIDSIKTVDKSTGKVLQGLLGSKNWELEKRLLRGTSYAHDAHKERVMLEIDLRGSLLDSVERNFLRAQVLYVEKIIDALVQIVEIERPPKFAHMKRDIDLFKSVLTVPIYLVGIP